MLRLFLVLALFFTLSAAQNLRRQWGVDEMQIKKLAVKDDNDLGAAFLGFIFGPILFLMSFVVIWYNQKRAAINHKRLVKIGQLLKKAQTNQNVSSENIGEKLIENSDPSKLIHLSGTVSVPVPAKDPISKLTGQKWLKLDRMVEVYEYRTVSSKKNAQPQLGWYSYHTPTAAQKTNDSANWFLKSESFTAGEAIISQYRMNQKQMDKMLTNINIPATAQIAQAIKQSTNRPKNNYFIEGDFIYFPSVGDIKLSHGTLRVKYRAFKPDVLSIIASYNNNRQLQPFRIDYYENKGGPDTLCCEGKSICCACNGLGEAMKPMSQVDIVMEGKKTSDQMINTMIEVNKAATNLLRVVAYFVMVLGIYAFFSPIVQILGYIPLVGGFLKGAAGTLIFLGALIICIPLFLLTFSLAWLVYHPKIGIVFLILAALMTALIVVLDQTYKDN